MEGGLPMLSCLLQNTLRSFCSSSKSCRWTYAVFWRIMPRIYPPPKWEYEGGVLDRSKGNKRNWILVWEDGYCNFDECERVNGRFGADVFFKLSHEVYNYGEGVLGKVAAENSHIWVFKASAKDEPSCLSSWNISTDHQPKAWENQFNSGIQTIALISVRDGIVQLGSLDKIQEDLNLVISTQRKFSYIQTIPGIFTIQRPANPYTIDANASNLFVSDKHQLARSKRPLYSEGLATDMAIKSINLGWNAPRNGHTGPQPTCSLPPLLPSVSYNLELLLSRTPYVAPSYDPTVIASEFDLIGDDMSSSVKAESEDKSCCLNADHGKSRFGNLRERDVVL